MAPRTVGLALVPAGLMAGYLFVGLMIFGIRLPERVESVALALLWLAGGWVAASVGLACGRRNPRLPAVGLGLSVLGATFLVAFTRLLGPDLPAVSATVAGWGSALVLLVVATSALVRRRGVVVAVPVAVAGGLALVLLATFMSARLHLSPEAVPWASAPWWLPVSVTDHAMVSADLVDRLDAIQLVAGMSVLLTLNTAYLLAYVVGAGGRPAALVATP